jgi:L-iditol 2-dehydrogenase
LFWLSVFIRVIRGSLFFASPWLILFLAGAIAMHTMKAIVKRGREVSLAEVPCPCPGPGEILVRVAVAGLCRTDLAVAAGKVPCPDPLLLGHEFSGWIAELGSGVQGWRPGERVAIMPIVPCEACANCQAGRGLSCLRRCMLGLDRDGAFAEFVSVPTSCVYRLPGGVSLLAGAYAEPVAAALGVLNADLHPQQKGLIYGTNRFSRLIASILRARGFADLTLHTPETGSSALAEDAYDFLIETKASSCVLAELIRAARPGATIVLRSRDPQPVSLNLLDALPKELTFRAVHYGPFPTAIALLAEGRLDLTELLGPLYPLDAWEQAFTRAQDSEAVKVFLSPCDEDVRNC